MITERDFTIRVIAGTYMNLYIKSVLNFEITFTDSMEDSIRMSILGAERLSKKLMRRTSFDNGEMKLEVLKVDTKEGEPECENININELTLGQLFKLAKEKGIDYSKAEREINKLKKEMEL